MSIIINYTCVTLFCHAWCTHGVNDLYTLSRRTVYDLCFTSQSYTFKEFYCSFNKEKLNDKNVKLGTAKENLTEMKKYRRQAYECDGFMSTLQLLYQCEHVSGCVMAGLN